jgi:hypothetical protein
MSATDKTADQMLGSLSGFDELAVTKQFGQTIQALIPDPEKGREGPSPWLYFRALAFIDMRRAGVKDADAYRQAMELSVAPPSLTSTLTTRTPTWEKAPSRATER